MLIKSKEVYNIRAGAKRKELGNLKLLEFLKQTFYNNGWKYALKQNTEGNIFFFMFTPPKLIKFANKYNRVFLLDCTYKTSWYKVPILHIVSISPLNSSCSAAFCFMQNEKEESYEWTLQTFFIWLDPLPFGSVLCTDRDLAL